VREANDTLQTKTKQNKKHVTTNAPKRAGRTEDAGGGWATRKEVDCATMNDEREREREERERDRERG
jgi:hypothetical protein